MKKILHIIIVATLLGIGGILLPNFSEAQAVGCPTALYKYNSSNGTNYLSDYASCATQTNINNRPAVYPHPDPIGSEGRCNVNTTNGGSCWTQKDTANTCNYYIYKYVCSGNRTSCPIDGATPVAIYNNCSGSSVPISMNPSAEGADKTVQMVIVNREYYDACLAPGHGNSGEYCAGTTGTGAPNNVGAFADSLVWYTGATVTSSEATGRIIGRNNNPISGVRVFLKNSKSTLDPDPSACPSSEPPGGVCYSTVTDANGNYFFSAAETQNIITDNEMSCGLQEFAVRLKRSDLTAKGYVDQKINIVNPSNPPLAFECDPVDSCDSCAGTTLTNESRSTYERQRMQNRSCATTGGCNFIVTKNQDALCYSYSVPSTMIAGQPYTTSFTMKNTGTTTWRSANSYNFGSQDPQDNTNWGGFNRVSLPSDTPPGSLASRTFNSWAPTTAGTYNWSWQMVQDGVEWFGDKCGPKVVTVTAPTPTPVPPTLGALKINANTTDSPPGQASGTYTKSGLRSDETPAGLNYYNSLTISQNATGSNIALVGAAFTNNASAPITCTAVTGQNCLSSLINSAYSNKGFIVIYSVPDQTVVGKHFLPDSHYMYFNNKWYGPLTTSYIPTDGNEILIKRSGTTVPPSNAKFDVTLKKSLGSSTWGTYGYVMNSSGVESSVAKTPSQ